MPANLKPKDYRKVLKIAKKAHQLLNCKGVTRSDFKFLEQILSFRNKHTAGNDKFIISSRNS